MVVVGVVFVIPRIVDPMECSKMLGEIIFADKCISAYVPVAMGTWELGGLVPVSLEVIKASKGFAAFALKGSVVEGFGVTLELGS